MAGSRALRKLQLGKETVKGTPVAATTIWRGMGVIKDNREIVFPQEDVGILGGTDRKYIARYWSELSMPAVEATFEQLPYLFEAGVIAETPAADGGGSDYIYEYTAPITAQNTHRTYTIEGGDDQQAEEFDYAFVKKISLSGAGQGALMMSADWMGREATNTTFTGALSIPTVEEVLVNNASFFIDAVGGTLGATAKSGLIHEVSMDYTTGLEAFWAVDASKDFNLTKFTTDEILFKLIYEHNANAVTEKAIYRAGTTQQFRLKFEGTDVATPGTTYSKKTMLLDFAGVYEDWGILDERNGNDVIEAAIRVRYNATAALKFMATIVNELSALP